MIIIANTNDSIKAVLTASANTEPKVYVCFRDIRNTAPTSYTPSTQTTQLNGTTPVTICNSPSEQHQLVIDTINVYNTNDLTIQISIIFDSNGDEVTLWAGNLNSGDILTYNEGNGWTRQKFSQIDSYVNSSGVITIPTTDIPDAPISGSISLFGRNLAGRSMLAQIGPSGLDVVLQPSFARNRVAWWNPPGNAATVPGVTGFTALTALGTVTARSVATTNRFQRIKRLGHVSTTTAGSFAGARSAAAQYTTGDGAGNGGFHFVCWFGCSDAAIVSGARQFIGLRNLTTAPTNTEPSAITQCIGVGSGAANSNLHVYYGGSVAQTPIDLGINFPANTLSSDMYELMLFCSPNETSINWRVTRLTNGQMAQGILNGSPGVEIPLPTTLLCFNSHRCNNTTALAVGIDFAQLYIETDY